MACFADINVSQGIVATYARCGGMFNIHLSANLLRNLLVKKNCKSVKIWQNYGHESVAPFLAHPVTECIIMLQWNIVQLAKMYTRQSATEWLYILYCSDIFSVLLHSLLVLILPTKIRLQINKSKRSLYTAHFSKYINPVKQWDFASGKFSLILRSSVQYRTSFSLTLHLAASVAAIQVVQVHQGPRPLGAHQRGPDSNFFWKITFFCFSRCQSQWLLQRDRYLNWS